MGISTRCTPIPIPPLLSSLLANHHTTLPYLGHCNVLLPSPMADALCRNLRKIGWEEERSEESGRREGLATEAEGGELSPLQKLKLLFCDFLPIERICCSLFSCHLPTPSLFASLWTVRMSHSFCRSFPLLFFSFFHNLICAVPKPFTKPLPKPQLWQRIWKSLTAYMWASVSRT